VVFIHVRSEVVKIRYPTHLKEGNSPVMVRTTSKTTTSGVLSVLAYTSMTSRYMAAVLASLRVTCRHRFLRLKKTDVSYLFIQSSPGPSNSCSDHSAPKDMQMAARARLVEHSCETDGERAG